MSIQQGDRLPEATLHTMRDGRPTAVTTSELFSGKKVVMFAIKAKGIDDIICVAVNDAFVMGAWGKAGNADALTMVGDGNGDFTKAIGLEMDGSGFGLGTRSQRYAMVIEDGVVNTLAVEAGGQLDVSSAESILKNL
jgi:peroxiredoxin